MQSKYIFIKSLLYLLFAVLLNFVFTANSKSQDSSVSKIHVAPAPLFRDLVTDGAADPVIVWNAKKNHGGCYIHKDALMWNRLMWLIVTELPLVLLNQKTMDKHGYSEVR